jgi:hypothetical protein
MNLLEFIFGKNIKVESAYFGTMVFIEDNQASMNSYFECQKEFLPTKKKVDILIEGDITGATQIQIDFFKYIEENYHKIIESISPLLEEEFNSWKVDFKIKNFRNEFEAIHLKIPRCNTKPIIWEIAFETIHDENHTYTITMNDLEPKEIRFEG